MRRELIFVVAAEHETALTISAGVTHSGLQARALSFDELFGEIEAQPPGAILIACADWEDPALRVCRRLSDHPRLSAVPVILLLDSNLEHLRLEALHAGADDCIAYPCSDRELAARLVAVLRRTSAPQPARRTDSELGIDVSAMKILVNNEEVPTTTLEFRLLNCLAKHQGRVLSRDMLLDAVWGEMRFVTPRTVDACIRRIRKKLEHDPTNPGFLKTLRGVGYRLDAAIIWHVAPPNDSCDCSICTGKPRRPRRAEGLSHKLRVRSEKILLRSDGAPDRTV